MPGQPHQTKPHDFAFPPGGGFAGGLSIREYYAGQIMAGFAASPDDSVPTGGYRGCARKAVEWADALIAALNAPPPEPVSSTGKRDAA